MSGTICLAVYRPDERLLRSQIDSIRSQTYVEWECLVGIDGKDAEARRVLDEAVGGDARFRIIEYERNVGFYRNFERLLLEVDDDRSWVALSDQDDRWYPDKIAALVPLLEHADLAFGQAVVVGGSSSDERAVTTSRRVTTKAAAMLDNQVTGSLSVFRRTVLDRALPFPQATDSAYHDHWLGVCALAGDGIAVHPDPVQDYVQHAGNVIGEERPRSVQQRLASLLRRAKGGPLAGLDYLSAHRWAWRVRMARAIGSIEVDQAGADARFVAAVARDRLSASLAATVLSEVAHRRAPALRSFALLAGAWRSPALRRERRRLDPGNARRDVDVSATTPPGASPAGR